MTQTCRTCGATLAKPGDYCLECRSPNADGVVVEATAARATLTILDGETILGAPTITTTPEAGELAGTQRRNFVGRIVDVIRRKRPDAVYMAGDRDLLREIRATIRYDCYRVAESDPVAAAIATRSERALDMVETPPAEKIGGSHSTLIGGRDGREAVLTVAKHPHVKKVVPGRIDAGGTGSQTGVRAKATRADDNGNVRLLVRDGSSVQENRVVTTARNRELGERVREDLNERLVAADIA